MSDAARTLDLLIEYAEEMQSLTGDSDAEICHGRADGLLVAALEALRAEVGVDMGIALDDILASYGNVNKWYA